GQPFLPFGGLQVILSGDFFQLPPVSKGLEKAKQVHFSQIWENMEIRICYLEEVKRQTDNDMVKVLNDIRNQEVGNETAMIVLSRENKEINGDIKPTKIFTHNKDVNNLNQEELDKLKGTSYAYKMVSSGNNILADLLKKGCLAPEKLVLKKNAVVMFVKNNFEKGYVNGTIGKVIDFDKETKLPIIKTLSGEGILAEPASWEYEEEGEIKASIKQIPLRLAWAITVHKSQGMTLDAAEIDLSNSFEYGMGYVALSRLKSLNGLKLLGINERAFEVDPEIAEFDEELISMSKETEKEFQEMHWLEKIKRKRKFIRRM
ncbi:MAG: PIF1 family ATP-dependent DNA helicase, partial [Candidatus Pacebacteria bacterium]|nr:PIF1 family ATP-dependent DNA helicase [Candidatus Paceibacterota bacterium]